MEEDYNDYIVDECLENEKNEKIDNILTPEISIIEKQKAIALELLENLREKYPFSIIAGGAPRDWDNNKEATDIDFWILPLDIYFSKDSLEELINLRLTDQESETKEYVVPKKHIYELIQIYIDKIYKTEYKEMNIDFIIMKTDKTNIEFSIKNIENYRKAIYDTFDFGLCMNSYDFDGYHPDTRYENDKNNKLFTLYFDNISSFISLQHIIKKHIKKLITKYPDYSINIEISDRMNLCFEQIYKNYFYMNNSYKGENIANVPF